MVGVPYNDAVLNKLAQQFGEYVQKIKSQYGENDFTSIRGELDELVGLKLRSKMNKIKDAEGNDVEVKTYTFDKSTIGSNVDGWATDWRSKTSGGSGSDGSGTYFRSDNDYTRFDLNDNNYEKRFYPLRFNNLIVLDVESV